MIQIVYRLVSGARSYIGVTSRSLEKRIDMHLYSSKRGTTPINVSIRENGIDSSEILFKGDIDRYEAEQIEAAMIAKYDTTFPKGLNTRMYASKCGNIREIPGSVWFRIPTCHTSPVSRDALSDGRLWEVSNNLQVRCSGVMRSIRSGSFSLGSNNHSVRTALALATG